MVLIGHEMMRTESPATRRGRYTPQRMSWVQSAFRERKGDCSSSRQLKGAHVCQCRDCGRVISSPDVAEPGHEARA